MGIKSAIFHSCQCTIYIQLIIGTIIYDVSRISRVSDLGIFWPPLLLFGSILIILSVYESIKQPALAPISLISSLPGAILFINVSVILILHLTTKDLRSSGIILFSSMAGFLTASILIPSIYYYSERSRHYLNVYSSTPMDSLILCMYFYMARTYIFFILLTLSINGDSLHTFIAWSIVPPIILFAIKGKYVVEILSLLLNMMSLLMFISALDVKDDALVLSWSRYIRGLYVTLTVALILRVYEVLYAISLDDTVFVPSEPANEMPTSRVGSNYIDKCKPDVYGI